MKTETIELGRVYHARDIGFDAAMDAQHEAEQIARSKGMLEEAVRCSQRREDLLARRRPRQEKRDPIHTLKDERLWQVAAILRREAELEELARAPVRAVETDVDEEIYELSDPCMRSGDPLTRWAKAPRVWVSGPSGKAVKRTSPPIWRPKQPKRQRSRPKELTVPEAAVSAKFRAMDAFDLAFDDTPTREACREVVLYRLSFGRACEVIWGARNGKRVNRVRDMVEAALIATDRELRRNGY